MVTHEQLQYIRFGNEFVVNILDGGQNTPLHGFMNRIIGASQCEPAEKQRRSDQEHVKFHEMSF